MAAVASLNSERSAPQFQGGPQTPQTMNSQSSVPRRFRGNTTASCCWRTSSQMEIQTGLRRHRWLKCLNLEDNDAPRPRQSGSSPSATLPPSASNSAAAQESKPSLQEPDRLLEIGRCKAIVTAESGIDPNHLEKALEATPFKEWIKNMAKEKRFEVSKVHFQSIDMFGPKVGFIKFKADVKIDNKAVPGIVFMRGGAVAVLVVLHNKGRKYSLVVRQARIPVSERCLIEIPAGMLGGDGTFAGVAAKELKEETGIVIQESELIDMTKEAYREEYPGMFPTCGGSDEFNRIFLFEKTVSTEELESYEGKLTGVAEQGEIIKLQIIPLETLWKQSPDAKALAALTLYDKLKHGVSNPKKETIACPVDKAIAESSLAPFIDLDSSAGQEKATDVSTDK